MEVHQCRNDFEFVGKCFFYERIREEKLEVMIVLRDWITIDIYMRRRVERVQRVSLRCSACNVDNGNDSIRLTRRS